MNRAEEEKKFEPVLNKHTPPFPTLSHVLFAPLQLRSQKNKFSLGRNNIWGGGVVPNFPPAVTPMGFTRNNEEAYKVKLFHFRRRTDKGNEYMIVLYMCWRENGLVT
jgi:hypothetical protein